jgi:two-component system, LytTR family, response regulator
MLNTLSATCVSPSTGSERLPVVVFVTAHDEYALRAFKAHAIDYLMKPYSDERFQATLDRAFRYAGAGVARTLMSQMQALLRDAGGPAGRASEPPLGTSGRSTRSS